MRDLEKQGMVKEMNFGDKVFLVPSGFYARQEKQARIALEK